MVVSVLLSKPAVEKEMRCKLCCRRNRSRSDQTGKSFLLRLQNQVFSRFTTRSPTTTLGVSCCLPPSLFRTPQSDLVFSSSYFFMILVLLSPPLLRAPEPLQTGKSVLLRLHRTPAEYHSYPHSDPYFYSNPSCPYSYASYYSECSRPSHPQGRAPPISFFGPRGASL